MAKIAARMNRMAPSGIRKVNEKALEMERAGERVLHFEIGRPDFDTPGYIKRAAEQALAEGKVHYTSNFGLMELRQAIADKLKRENHVDYKASEVLVTVGLSEAVFAVLAFGLFLLTKWAWTGMTVTTGFFSYSNVWYPVWVMAAGLLLSLYWFRRHGQKNGPMSRWLLLALAVVIACGVGTLAWNWYVLSPEFLDFYSETYPHVIPWQIILQRELVTEGGWVYALIALAGLVLAKCYDRRWLALYVLSVTVAALCGFILLHMHRMDMSYAISSSIQAYLFARLIPIGAVGLIGTGVALC